MYRKKERERERERERDYLRLCVVNCLFAKELSSWYHDRVLKKGSVWSTFFRKMSMRIYSMDLTFTINEYIYFLILPSFT